MLGREDDAREVVQEVFASMLENGVSFRGQSSVRTCLYAATTNACLNRIRNEKTRARILRESHDPSPAVAPDAEAAALVRDVLARVPESLARVAILYYLDEMTHDEIARVLGC